MTSINDLNIISNLESLNATLIKKKNNKKGAFYDIIRSCEWATCIARKYDYIKSIKKIDNTTYVDAPKLSAFDQNLTKALNYNPEKEEPSK